MKLCSLAFAGAYGRYTIFSSFLYRVGILLFFFVPYESWVLWLLLVLTNDLLEVLKKELFEGESSILVMSGYGLCFL